MEVKKIDMEDLHEYVYSAFIDDKELIEFYDRSANVKTTAEAIENVCEKIRGHYPDAKIFGIHVEGKKEGYFVYKDDLLISFGMSVSQRSKKVLEMFWEQIKERVGNKFSALLYSHNTRAIGFLQKGGMKIEYDHITVLSYN